MKAAIVQYYQSTELVVGETSFCFLQEEIDSILNGKPGFHSRDGYRLSVVSRDRIIIFTTGDKVFSTEHIQAPVQMLNLYLDVAKLFKCARTLREKWMVDYKNPARDYSTPCRLAKVEVDLDQFRFPPGGVKKLSIVEVIRHKNAEGQFSKTIAYFLEKLKSDQKRRFLETVAHYVQIAKVYAQRDEFYFDGRIPNGCGFNGGIILHRDEFGVHT